MDEEAAQKNLGRMAKVIEMTPFMRHLGMEFVEGGQGYARIKMRYQHENSTVGKALHGGAISSLIDTTGAMAAWTTAEIATPRYFGSTVGVNVNYLSAAIGEDIFADGRILKRGKEIIYCDVRVANAEGKLIAQGTVVYRIVLREPQDERKALREPQDERVLREPQDERSFGSLRMSGFFGSLRMSGADVCHPQDR